MSKQSSMAMILGLAVLLASPAHADRVPTRNNLRPRAEEPPATKKKENKKKFNDRVEREIDFWARELGGTDLRNLKAIKKSTG